MRRIPFSKMSGAGNDFVLVRSGRPGSFSGNLPALARLLCDRRRGVGADGLLVVRDARGGAPPRVLHFNSDGSKAFCGNGSRCAAWWLRRRGSAKRSLLLETAAGRLQADIIGPERVRLEMPAASRIRLGLRPRAAGKSWTAHEIHVGVPHLVVEVPRLDGFPVVAAGRALRRHRAFAPAGVNVDFIRVLGGTVHVRTYERGVEAETPACGTGLTAAALCAHLLHGTPSPVRLVAASGDLMTASFRSLEGSPSDVRLEGPARITFTGEISL